MINFYCVPQNLSDLSNFRHDKRVQFKEENISGVDVVIPCYMIADSDFWKIPYATEMRAIRGQEVNYVDYFIKNQLKDNFSLDCVYNKNF